MLLQALALDLGDDGARARRIAPPASSRACDGGGHAVRDVLHGHQHVDFGVRRFHLLLRRGGVEAVADVVVLRRGVLLQLAARHVVVGEQQAVRADEGRRPAVVHAHRRQADVVEPRLRGREVVFLLQLLDGRVVEGPHAFVGDAAPASAPQATAAKDHANFGACIGGDPPETFSPLLGCVNE